MSYKKTSIWSTIDWISILLYILMVAGGWFSICGASYEYESLGWFNPTGRPGSQLIWITLSFALIFVVLMLDTNFFNVFAYAIYAIVILVLILTIFLAPDIKGSRSWLVIGPYLRIQPAEFAKFATALALAKFMSVYGFRLGSIKNYAIVIAIIAVPLICVLLQKETGSALIFLALFLVLYREGMSGYVLLAGISAITFFVISLKFSETVAGITPLGEMITLGLVQLITAILGCLVKPDSLQIKILTVATASVYILAFIVSEFIIPVNFVWVALGLLAGTSAYLVYLSIKNWVYRYLLVILFAVMSVAFIYSVDYVFDKMLEPHQQTRIKVSLGLEDDPRGVGYNVNQSKIAIGSGGFSGKGFLNGTQTKLKYVPEQDTDFIFCTVGEEEGFLGSLAVIILFSFFIIRLYMLAEKQKTVFARIYGYSVASVFFMHVVINIGMVTGITPVIGIPLPFFSYGGSSLWGFTLLLFIFLRLDSARKER
jgi:rod shape determining protein RodA